MCGTLINFLFINMLFIINCNKIPHTHPMIKKRGRPKILFISV